MIIFHEGLPRAGKSLAAMKDWVIPALKKGRKVFAYVEGINHEKVAEVAGITLEACQGLLFPLTREQVPEIYAHVENDSLVVIDEVQNFWQTGREKLKPEITQFITEHGHRGLDIVLMGQDINDVHTMWRRRVAQKNYYFKREALGKPDEFRVTIFKPVLAGEKLKWQEVSKSKPEKYDEAIFGCYASHTEDTENKEILVDQRAVVWNNPILRKWLPLYGVVAAVSLGVVIWAFTGGIAGSSTAPQAKKAPAVAAASPAPVPTAAAPAAAPKKETKGENYSEFSVPDDPPDMIDRLSKENRIRLTGAIQGKGRTSGYIEWRNQGFGVVERLSFDDLKVMGWQVLVNQDMTIAILQNYHKRYIASQWPLPDPVGKVSSPVQEEIKGLGDAPRFTPSPAASPSPDRQQASKASVAVGDAGAPEGYRPRVKPDSPWSVKNNVAAAN